MDHHRFATWTQLDGISRCGKQKLYCSLYHAYPSLNVPLSDRLWLAWFHSVASKAVISLIVSIVAEDAIVVIASGVIIVADGVIVITDGVIVIAGGVIIVADGVIVITDGVIVIADGVIIITDGVIVIASHTIIVITSHCIIVIISPIVFVFWSRHRCWSRAFVEPIMFLSFVHEHAFHFVQVQSVLFAPPFRFGFRSAVATEAHVHAHDPSGVVAHSAAFVDLFQRSREAHLLRHFHVFVADLERHASHVMSVPAEMMSMPTRTDRVGQEDPQGCGGERKELHARHACTCAYACTIECSFVGCHSNLRRVVDESCSHRPNAPLSIPSNQGEPGRPRAKGGHLVPGGTRTTFSFPPGRPPIGGEVLVLPGDLGVRPFESEARDRPPTTTNERMGERQAVKRRATGSTRPIPSIVLSTARDVAPGVGGRGKWGEHVSTGGADRRSRWKAIQTRIVMTQGEERMMAVPAMHGCKRKK